MDIGTFNTANFNAAATALTAAFEASEEQKEALKSVTREQVLAGVANAATSGNIPNSIIICMATSTNSYFDKITGDFDYEEWKKMIEQCALVPPPVTFPTEPIFETRAVLLALAVGYGIGMTVAFMLK